MARDEDFPRIVQQQALARQGNRCASCGESIRSLGEPGREFNRFDEIGHAHHMRPIKEGGTAALSNCVLICQACHYAAHEGGRYRTSKVIGTREDFPYFGS